MLDRKRGIAYLLFALYSLWLMFSSFSYDRGEMILKIGTKVWSDFAAHIPLIRSFSLGANWPPEYPLYPGSPIQYHYLFYWFVGKLEQLGIPLDIALNLPSALGFFFALFFLCKLIQKETGRFHIGLLAVVFFLFQGSMAFIRLFEKHGVQALRLVWRQTELSAMGPWDGGDILAFWHLNTWTNQRHFAFGLGILLAFWYSLRKDQASAQSLASLLKKPLPYLWGLAIGVMSQIHKPVFAMMAMIGVFEFIRQSKLRPSLVATGATALLLTLLWPLTGLHIGINSDQVIQWYPGFHLHGQFSWFGFLQFWFKNWGFHFLLLPVGFYLADKSTRSLLWPAVALFITAHLFRFSSDVLANHKFLNFTQLILCVFTAVVVSKSLLRIRELHWAYQRVAALVVLILACLLLTASGIIDHIAQWNERKHLIPDVGQDPVATWIEQNTKPQDVFLNSRLLYHPASIAGRKVFVGWPYFIITAGYDYERRKQALRKMYATTDPQTLCALLKDNNIDYMTIENTAGDSEIPAISADAYARIYTFDYDDGQTRILSTKKVCELTPLN